MRGCTPHATACSARTRPSFSAKEIPLRRVWLGDIIRLHEKKYVDPLVWHAADVHGSVRPVTWLVPVDLPRPDFDVLLRTLITKFNSQNVAVQHNGHAMEWISMPPRGFALREQQPPYQSGST